MPYGDEYQQLRVPLKGGGGPKGNPKPIDLIPAMNGTKPWYQSTTIIGLLVLVTTIILKRFGIDASGEESALTTLLMGAGEIIGAVMVLIGRLKAKKEIVIKPEVLGLILVALIMIPASGCSVVNETDEPDASARVEFGTRTVLGFVLFDWVGIGLFLPSKTIVELQETSK
jgi:hypothetical protein